MQILILIQSIIPKHTIIKNINICIKINISVLPTTNNYLLS